MTSQQQVQSAHVLRRAEGGPFAALSLHPAVLAALVFLTAHSADAAYFVDNNASGCSNGVTTYDPVTRQCGAGDDTVFTGWRGAHDAVPAGTQDQPTVINVRSGTAYHRLVLSIRKAWTTWRRYPDDDARPIIDNLMDESLSHYWTGVVSIYADGVTIDGIEIANSGHYPNHEQDWPGFGVYVDGAEHVHVLNSFIHHIGAAAVHYRNEANHGVVENNLFHECEYMKLEGERSGWGGVVTAIIHSNDGRIVNNQIWGSGGEGINLQRGSDGWTIADNVLWDHSRPTIYLAGSARSVVYNNIVYHTGNHRYGGEGNSFGYLVGISVSCEDCRHMQPASQRPDSTCHLRPANIALFTPSDGNIVYNNLVAGMDIGVGLVGSGQYSCGITNNNFFHNTVINSYVSSVATQDHDHLGEGHEFSGNLFWQNDGAIASVQGGSPPESKVDFRNNLWSRAPVSSARDSSDPTNAEGYPSLSMEDYFVRSTGWDNLTDDSLSLDDFMILPSAIYAIDHGEGRSDLFDVDCFGTPRPQGEAWDLGAHELTSSTQQYECNDGIDNDEDGSTDYPQDLGCSSATDDSESDCGDYLCHDGEDHSSCPVDCPDGPIIPSDSWSCVADSEETEAIDGECENGFDGDTSTSWHTNWTGDSPLHPHYIDIDLNNVYTLEAVRYVPRQVVDTSGIVSQYNIYVSLDGESWASVSTGHWTYDAREPMDVSFERSSARFLRFETLDDNTHHWAAAAEIILLGERAQDGCGTLEANQVCCQGVVYVGDCCSTEQCTSPDSCQGHTCLPPCSDGDMQECYEGAAGTEGAGRCIGGARECVSGEWGACGGQLLPEDEVCNNLDDDCDGEVDEDFDFSADREHCGGCYILCDADQVCSNSVCKEACDDGLTDCSGSCVALDNNVQHCGACDHACPDGQECTAGLCGRDCAPGFEEINGHCMSVEPQGCACRTAGPNARQALPMAFLALLLVALRRPRLTRRASRRRKTDGD